MTDGGLILIIGGAMMTLACLFVIVVCGIGFLKDKIRK